MVLDDLVGQKVVIKYDGLVGNEALADNVYIGTLASHSLELLKLENCIKLYINYQVDDIIALVVSGKAKVNNNEYYERIIQKKDYKNTPYEDYGGYIGKTDLYPSVIINPKRILEIRPADSYVKHHLKEK